MKQDLKVTRDSEFGTSSFSRALRIGLAASSIGAGASNALAGHQSVDALLARASVALRTSVDTQRVLEERFERLDDTLTRTELGFQGLDSSSVEAAKLLQSFQQELVVHQAKSKVLDAALMHELEDIQFAAINDLTRAYEEGSNMAQVSLRRAGVSLKEANFMVSKALAVSALSNLELTGYQEAELHQARESIERLKESIERATPESELGKKVSQMSPDRAAILASTSITKEFLNDVPIINTGLCILESSISTALEISRAFGTLMIMSSGAMAPGSPPNIKMNIQPVVQVSIDQIVDDYTECVQRTKDAWDRMKNGPGMYDISPREGGDDLPSPGVKSFPSSEPEGPSNDVPANEGPSNRGPRNDGPSNAGPSNDSPRNDGPSCDPGESCPPGIGWG